MKIILFLLAVILVGVVFYFIANPKRSKKQNNAAGEWPPEVVEKANRDRAARKIVQKQNPVLFASVTAAMFRQDPIGINFETNTDEYDAEAGTVIPRLKNCFSAEDVATVLHEEFIRWFGADTAGDRQRYMNLATEIWKLWNETKIEKGAASK